MGVEAHGLPAVLTRAQSLPGAQRRGWSRQEALGGGKVTFCSKSTDPKEELFLGFKGGCIFPRGYSQSWKGDYAERPGALPICLDPGCLLYLLSCCGASAPVFLASRPASMGRGQS